MFTSLSCARIIPCLQFLPLALFLKKNTLNICILHLLLIYLKHLNLLDFTSASVASVVVFMSFIMSRPTLKTKTYSSEKFLKAFDHTKVVTRSHK